VPGPGPGVVPCVVPTLSEGIIGGGLVGNPVGCGRGVWDVGSSSAGVLVCIVGGIDCWEPHIITIPLVVSSKLSQFSHVMHRNAFCPETIRTL
jgi:hypothetical protein